MPKAEESLESIGVVRVYPKLDNLGEGIVPFDIYFDQHVEMIREVQSILAHPLSDDPVIMDSQAREAESKLGQLKSIEGFANSYLDAAEHVALGKMPGRSSEWTDLDRSTALAANVAWQRRFRDIIVGIIESIETRISYTQSRLRFLERNHAS